MRKQQTMTYADAIRSFPRIALLNLGRFALLEHKALWSIARWPTNDHMRVDRKLLVGLCKATNLVGPIPTPPIGASAPISSGYESVFESARLPRTRVSFQQPKKRM